MGGGNDTDASVILIYGAARCGARRPSPPGFAEAGRPSRGICTACQEKLADGPGESPARPRERKAKPRPFPAFPSFPRGRKPACGPLISRPRAQRLRPAVAALPSANSLFPRRTPAFGCAAAGARPCGGVVGARLYWFGPGVTSLREPGLKRATTRSDEGLDPVVSVSPPLKKPLRVSRRP